MDNKDVVILHIRDYVLDKYLKIQQLREPDKDYSKDFLAKKLTRNFILGMIREAQSDDKYQVRAFGNLKMVVDIENLTMVGLYKNTSDYREFINRREQKDLNMLYGLPKNCK